MSDLTSELNLALAVDDDDTADYLVKPEGLRGSLLTLDGMFNSATGHAHNGAHQGGSLQFLNLTVGQNLTVVGSSTLQGAVIAQATLHAVGAATLDSTLSVGTNLTVSGTSHLVGTVQIDGTITSSGALTIGQDLLVGRDLTVTRNATITGALTAGSISTGGGSLNVGANLTVGGAATITGVLSAGRGVFGGSDYGHALNVGGNGMASGYWYQRAGAARCWDNADFALPAVAANANTPVLRDGSGYVTATYIKYSADVAAGKPVQVLGQNGDGFMRWWPTNSIGPPISSWFLQASLQLPALSNNGGTADATVTAVSNSLGAGISGGVVTVPRPGYYSIAGGFNGNNLTGNTEGLNMTLISSAHGTLDSMSCPLKISSYFGGYFSWSGFLNQGETFHLQFNTSFDSISGSGEMILTFIPTATYNN
jgi:hypothetical protein